MQSCLSSYEGSWKAFMTTISQGALADVESALSSALADGAVITAPAALDAYTADTYWPALHAKAAGAPLGAAGRGRAAAHRGGRCGRAARSPPSSASRSSPGAADRAPRAAPWPINGGLVDRPPRARRDRSRSTSSSMTVTRAGRRQRPRARAELNERGLMLPHYPASVEWATVGGYIAARGSGVLSHPLRQDRGSRALAARRDWPAAS